MASPPAYTRLGSVPDSVKTWSKARLEWYNRLPSDVVSEEIWPKRATRKGQNQVTVLNLDYFPNRRGTYNFSPHLDATLHRNKPDSLRTNWNGIMRYIGTTAGSILDQNITYLEVWAKVISKSPNDLQKGRLYVDLGRISEAVFPNWTRQNPPSEDYVSTQQNPSGFPNSVLNPGEDIGIDMEDDGTERVTHDAFLASNAGDPDVSAADPSGDDWAPYTSSGKYEYPDTNLVKFNGTEGNSKDPSGLYPNTTDLNGNNALDETNQYLEYEIPLDTTYIDSSGVTVQNALRVGGGQNGWIQFRIPLLEATRSLGSQSAQSILQNVQYLRLWVSGFEEPVSIRIAEMDLVGNQWQERTKNDTIMKVSTVNVEDNADYAAEFTQLGIVREKDRTDPSQIIEGNEQSLALVINNLPRDSSRECFKSFNIRPLDLFNYKSMKMFVHGDPTFTYVSPTEHDAEIYIRFGSDSLNFYEYRAPIHPGWDMVNNEVNIVFSELTTVKSARDSTSAKLHRIPVRNGPPGATYGIQGSPSLRQVREIVIGVRNSSPGFALKTRYLPPLDYLSGQIWVNELRLVDVENSAGVAYHFDTQLKLADFGNMQFNYSRTDPNFHALDQRFGSQTTGINWQVNANVALEKFFPQDWQGTSIPIGYAHSENLVKPKYLPNTDVVVDAAASHASTPAAADKVITESQSLHVQDSYSLSNFHIAPPIQAWYWRDTFNKLSFGFNYSTSSDRDPSIAERTGWLWNARMNYAVSLPPDYYIQPFKSIFNGIFLLNEFKEWKLYYVPFTNLSGSLGGQRSRSYEIARAPGSTPRETRNFGATKAFGFGWKLTEGGLTSLSGDYGLSIDRNLLPLDNDTVGRNFSSILRNLLVGGRDGRYGQRVTINSKPKLPNIFDITKYIDLNAQYSVNYGWQNSFQGGDAGKSAGWDNNISLSMSLRLKSLTDPWFETKDEPAQAQPPEQRRNQDREKDEGPPDSTKPKDQKKPVETGPSKSFFSQIKNVAKVFVKIPFLDYENINISFSQTNRSGNAGVIGSTGFKNFWGRLPFQGSLLENGPSRLYQLGLITDPSGTLRYSPKSSFPFIGWRTEPGLRAAKTSFTDQFSQSNNLALRTNRPLWTGATLEINWKVGWQFTKSTTLTTDSLGHPFAGEPATGGSIERSFLTLPPVLFFKVFKSNLEDVGRKFEAHPQRTTAPNVALADAFERGMEALPILNKIFGQYVPRPNWTLRWDGVEKIVGLSSVLERMSLEHTYNSSFRKDFRGFAGKEE
ncbi:MAG: cell surface protein SprA, partial [Ignavibacteriales bacterium]|nr:cell surface protein SprA [Ignavibacteriales bacterium]